MDSINYADEQMPFISSRFPQLGEDELKIIRLTILEAYREARNPSSTSYTKLYEVFNRKMLEDLNHDDIDSVDEYRRISRGIFAIATYLDQRGNEEKGVSNGAANSR
jgi:hypothetical protein